MTRWAYTGKRQPSEHDIPRLSGDGPVKFCLVMPDDYKLRPDGFFKMQCRRDPGHSGDHRNLLGETWAMARRPRLIERVEERRRPSW